jgi:hypothetical protein
MAGIGDTIAEVDRTTHAANYPTTRENKMATGMDHKHNDYPAMQPNFHKSGNWRNQET